MPIKEDLLQTASGTEYCPGFHDQHEQWNNGFFCPKWGGPDIKYCCGPETHKYCCPKEESLEELHGNQAQQLSLLIGLAVGSFILLMGTLLLTCYFCRCCWAYKRRKRSQAGSPVLPAYPGYGRDSMDPVNYAICPHGTVLPEFLVPAPRYPTDAPPPYPGHEQAPPMQNKDTLPPPHVQEHDGTDQTTYRVGIQRSVSHPERSMTERHSVPERDRLHSDYLSDRNHLAMDTGAQTELVGQGRSPDVYQSCYRDSERQSQQNDSGASGPSTSSRRISNHIPKIKSSSHRSSKRRSGYDSRSISSDSDTFSS